MNCFGAGFSCSGTNPLVLLGEAGMSPHGGNNAQKMLKKMHFSFSFEVYSPIDDSQVKAWFRECVLLACLVVTIVFGDLPMEMKREQQELCARWGGYWVQKEVFSATAIASALASGIARWWILLFLTLMLHTWPRAASEAAETSVLEPKLRSGGRRSGANRCVFVVLNKSVCQSRPQSVFEAKLMIL